MKTIFLLSSILVLTSLAASGQVAPGRNQPVNSPAPGANYSGGAEYAAVSMAPRTGGAYNQGNLQGGIRQQGRTRGGAQYVAVSIAPRRR